MGSRAARTSAPDLTARMIDLVIDRRLLTWADLATAVREPLRSVELQTARRRRAFTSRVIVAAPRGKVEAPPPKALVFPTEALAEVARSGRLWRLALEYVRGEATHLFPAGEVGRAFRSSVLNEAFGAALREALATRTLPLGIGAVLRRGHFYLLLQDDLLMPPLSLSPSSAPPLAAPPEAPPAPPSTSDASEAFARDFERAFSALDARSGGRNFVKLAGLRQALAQYPRDVFDRQLNALRRAGRFSLDAAEGRHDQTTPDERDAGLWEGGRRLLYCARR